MDKNKYSEKEESHVISYAKRDFYNVHIRFDVGLLHLNHKTEVKNMQTYAMSTKENI